MTTPPTGFCAIGFTFVNTLNGRTGQINFGIELEPTHALSDVTANLRTGLVDIAQDCTTNIVWVGVRYTFPIGDGSTGGIDVPFLTPILGGVSGNPMSPQVCYLVKKNTDVFGVHGKGRYYLPGVSEGLVDGAGIIDNDFRTDMTNHAATALETWATNDVPMFLLAGGSSPSTPITTLAAEGSVATQRRRLVRVAA